MRLWSIELDICLYPYATSSMDLGRNTSLALAIRLRSQAHNIGTTDLRSAGVSHSLQIKLRVTSGSANHLNWWITTQLSHPFPHYIPLHHNHYAHQLAMNSTSLHTFTQRNCYHALDYRSKVVNAHWLCPHVLGIKHGLEKTSTSEKVWSKFKAPTISLEVISSSRTERSSRPTLVLQMKCSHTSQA